MRTVVRHALLIGPLLVGPFLTGPLMPTPLPTFPLGPSGGALLAAQEPPAAGVANPEAPTWADLRSRPDPEWFLDAKLGIFIHWGVYSVPAFSGKEDYAEWFVRGLQLGDTLRTRFLRENYGPDFQYRDFAPLFKAELFDPAEWADLFRRSGARYVVLVSKHHDGYALWPSRYSPGWNSVDVGPGRDLVGVLTEAVREAGLRMGLYYSLAEWSHPLHRWYTDPPDSIGRYVTEYMIPQLQEVVSRYRPTVLFSDGDWLNTAEQWHARELIGWYFDTVGPDAIVNDRWGAGSDIGFRTPEYSAGIQLADRPWAEVRGLGRSFGLNRNEKLDAYLSPRELVRTFARAVAAGGGMILNVGPGGDGQIPLLQQERLLQLGQWLQVNGEAIYGSRRWRRSGETREVSLERVDPAIDFDWVRNTPGRPIREDDFTATWTGFLEPTLSGDYIFEAEADDFVRVWVDGRLVVDEWGEEGGGDPGPLLPATANPRDAHPSPLSIHLEAGSRYPIRAEYREVDVNASVRLFWSREGVPREIVPATSFFTGAEAEAPPGLEARYTSRQEYLAYTRKGDDLYVISFDWPDGELVVPIPAPASGTRAALLGREGTLPWTYRAGALRVDLTGIPYGEIPGEWAWTIRLSGYETGEPS
ncbi:MAG: alpha-L-fucosidase [Longimicrobiales bacterium]